MQARIARRKLYEDAGVPEVAALETGRVTAVAPLLPLQLVLVCVDHETVHQHEIYLGQGTCRVSSAEIKLIT
jgi:hypothetical protein